MRFIVPVYTKTSSGESTLVHVLLRGKMAIASLLSLPRVSGVLPTQHLTNI